MSFALVLVVDDEKAIRDAGDQMGKLAVRDQAGTGAVTTLPATASSL
jgi:hypothetical protein